MSKIIEIKKSTLATLRGLGKTTQEIAKHFGVTNEEITEVLAKFEMLKRRTKKEKTAEYEIKAVDDVAVNQEVKEKLEA